MRFCFHIAKIFCTGVFFGIVLNPVFAFARTAPAQAPVVCAKLADRATYDDKKFEDFKMLINGTEGWMYRSSLDLKYRFRLTDRTLDFFARLNDALRQNNTDLVVAMIPTRGMTSHVFLTGPQSKDYDPALASANYRVMLDELRGTGLRVAAFGDFKNMAHFFYPRDNHWTPEGAKAMADTVASEVRALASFQSIPQKKFITKTRAATRELRPNSYEETADKICGRPNRETTLSEIYETAPVEGALSESDLFGDQKPEISLLGTSNSTQPAPSYANFAGFLQQSLGADLYNEAISGGSLEGSISNYLISGRYRETHPKIVIWEMAAYYGYNRQAFFREIIPSIYGECADDKALRKTSVTLKPANEETTILDDLAPLNLNDHTHYVFLKFSDPQARNIKVRFMYEGGRRDTVDLKRAPRNFPKTNGLYFAELSDLMLTPVQSVSVEAPGLKGSVEAKLCSAPAQAAPGGQRAGKAKPALKNHEAGLRKTPEKSWMRRLWTALSPPGHGIKIEAAARQDFTASKLPDLSGYTVKAVRDKMPALKPGKVEIAPMEGAPPLRKYAFDKRLVEMRDIQGRVQPLAIHIRSGVYDLPGLMAAVKGTDYLVQKQNAYILRLPLAIYPGAALVLRDLDRPLYLAQDKGAFIANAGHLFIVRSALSGWNEKTALPARLDPGYRNFRPFITGWDGSQTYIAAANLDHLGYALSKSYGLSLSTNEVVQEQFFDAFGDLPPPTGWIIGSDFSEMYFGFYSYEAKNVVIHGNRYADNVIYGIDPHDRSTGLIIAGNTVSKSREKHGIILSRAVNDSFIFGNTTENNKGAGIMLDRNCRNTVVANNVSRGNGGDGITVYESPDNILQDNVIEGNKGGGIRIRNSWNVKVMGGRIRTNEGPAFILYEDDLKNTGRDFAQDPVQTRAAADFDGVYLESNQGVLKTSGFDSAGFHAMQGARPSLSPRLYDGDLRALEDRIGRFQADHPHFSLRRDRGFFGFLHHLFNDKDKANDPKQH